MSTILALAKLVGQRGLVQAGEHFRIQVEVQDVEVRHGRTRVFVQPVAGMGQAWIDLSLIVFEEGETARVRAGHNQNLPAQQAELSQAGEALMAETFAHVQVGDIVGRLFTGTGMGTVPMRLRVTEVADGIIYCGPRGEGWSFDAETGLEVDDYLQWGPQYGKSGSYLVAVSNDDGE